MEGTNILTSIIHQFLLFVPVFLYAEIHYRFKYFFSLLKKSEPEIIADAPYRIEPGVDIPLLLLIKDSHHYPCVLGNVTVKVMKQGKLIHSECVHNKEEAITQKWWWSIYPIKATKEMNGKIELDVEFTIEYNHKKRSYHNDNYRTSSHAPLKLFISQEPLPSYKSLYLGEIHSHSNYTEDQVEFGAPIEPTAQLAKALGLSFFAVTDHSYDLDDHPDNYLLNHPETPKWFDFQNEVSKLQNSSVTIIPGEEVTCRNNTGENVHLLILNNKIFFPGSGDSAERWLRTQSELSISEVTAQLGTETITIAAHPLEPVSILQRILLNRGNWQNDDFEANQINGIQFINGMLNDGNKRGYEFWINTLLSGKRVSIVAGNDAHGNFNRFRQISIPFLKIGERNNQIFGEFRTGIFAPDKSRESILESLRLGKTIATNGPVANITRINNHTSLLGSEIKGGLCIHCQTLSSQEFGTIKKVLLYEGIKGNRIENILYELNKLETYSYKFDLLITVKQPKYIRLEVYTENAEDKKQYFCITNPVWFTYK
ncbi:MAG TPA: CehA/McbA family metallohydrolase [Bacteroidota bacterium]|nr:CehA/McbA family metallohydrolase [Bacteroidota bacterium]